MSRLAGLVHSLGNIERDLRRRGVVQPPTPEIAPDEKARLAELAAIVEAHATENEKAHLAFRSIRSEKRPRRRHDAERTRQAGQVGRGRRT
jgi:hypothetical protein